MKEYEKPLVQVISLSVNGALTATTDVTVLSYGGGVIDLGLGEPNVGDVEPPAPK